MNDVMNNGITIAQLGIMITSTRSLSASINLLVAGESPRYCRAGRPLKRTTALQSAQA